MRVRRHLLATKGRRRGHHLSRAHRSRDALQVLKERGIGRCIVTGVDAAAGGHLLRA